jgi:hypothetical protein
MHGPVLCVSNLFLVFIHFEHQKARRDRYKKIKRSFAVPVVCSCEIPNIRFKSRFTKEIIAVCVVPKIAHKLRIQQLFNKHAVADFSLSSHGGTERPWMVAGCYYCIYIRHHNTKRFHCTLSTLLSKSGRVVCCGNSCRIIGWS